jgi:NitT/TauT family transport system ATP-binding protein
VEPDLLLLDEPFVSLDSALAIRMREQLVSLVDKRAMTTLLVTHDLEEAVRLADRVFLLSARPAKIVADIPLAMPRRLRTEVDVAAMLADLSRRVNGGPAA